MSANSPQRSRRVAQQQQAQVQGAMHNHPAREASSSPPGSISQRPRATKTQSMPLVPSVTSFPGQNNQQPSPTIRRSSPPLGPGQVARLLPTPPHPNPPFAPDDQSPSSAQQHQAHYARGPPLRAPTAAYPNKFQELESQMTPEFFADIDRAAEQQQAQYLYSNQTQPQPQLYPKDDAPSPGGKASLVDRARVAPTGRSSPLNPVNLAQRVGGQQQQQSHTRDSPKTRDRQPASPNGPPFSQQQQGQSQTPEQHQSQHPSPSIMTGGEPHPASYLAQYNARASESPTVRRAANSEPRMSIASMANQSQSTPPLQSNAGRSDRSLPVQEEDEVLSRNGNVSLSGRNANQWGVGDNQPSFEAPSPTPSSDLNPEGSLNAQRFDVGINVHHDEDKHRQPLGQQQQDDSHHGQYVERDSTEEDGSYTPRSPSAGLPNDGGSRQMLFSGQNIPIRVPVPVSLRNNNRNGSTDHLMRGLEGVLLDQQNQDQQQQQQQTTSGANLHQQLEQNPDRPPPKYHDQRQQQISQSDQYQDASSPQNYTPTSTIFSSASTANNSSNDYNQASYNPNTRYLPQPQVYPDDFQGYPEDYYQAYFASPGRPDAPIPPTPHSQTAAPSPSPLISGYGGNQDLPAYRPMRAAGSPYPFPFAHVRRNRPIGQPGNRNGLLSSGLAVDPARIARQYQIYAQNAHQGNITDSTLSPSSTPFRPDNLFDQWAYLHTTRTLNLNHNIGMRNLNNLDTASILSSPSHEPLPLPDFSAIRREKRGKKGRSKLGNEERIRQLPPRVESTQPRETSPELSSGSESGEETAGEERHHLGVAGPQMVATDPLPFAPVVILNQEEPSDEWVDDDEDDDFEDLLDVEYHPTFINNASKRRRKWEVGWENLIQAFQALDRQTDTTMILLAAPSHTTKLHALRSRSIRRRPVLAHSTNMKDIRKGFAQIAADRRSMRPEKSSLVDRLLAASKIDSSSGSDGSSSSSDNVNLKRSLDAALVSLRAMREVYEQREARVAEELQRSREDRERAELLLRQILDDRYSGSGRTMGNGNAQVVNPGITAASS